MADTTYGQNLRQMNRSQTGLSGPMTSLPRGPQVGFQQPKTNIPQVQQNLQQQVGNIPLPVDTSALIAQQTALQKQIAAMYAEAERNQARGYATQMANQSELNALLGLDPTAGTDQAILDAIQQARLDELNNPRGNRAIWAYGFQRNG